MVPNSLAGNPGLHGTFYSDEQAKGWLQAAVNVHFIQMHDYIKCNINNVGNKCLEEDGKEMKAALFNKSVHLDITASIKLCIPTFTCF